MHLCLCVHVCVCVCVCDVCEYASEDVASFQNANDKKSYTCCANAGSSVPRIRYIRNTIEYDIVLPFEKCALRRAHWLSDLRLVFFRPDRARSRHFRNNPDHIDIGDALDPARQNTGAGGGGRAHGRAGGKRTPSHWSGDILGATNVGWIEPEWALVSMTHQVGARRGRRGAGDLGTARGSSRIRVIDAVYLMYSLTVHTPVQRIAAYTHVHKRMDASHPQMACRPAGTAWGGSRRARAPSSHRKPESGRQQAFWLCFRVGPGEGRRRRRRAAIHLRPSTLWDRGHRHLLGCLHNLAVFAHVVEVDDLFPEIRGRGVRGDERSLEPARQGRGVASRHLQAMRRGADKRGVGDTGMSQTLETCRRWEEGWARHHIHTWLVCGPLAEPAIEAVRPCDGRGYMKFASSLGECTPPGSCAGGGKAEAVLPADVGKRAARFAPAGVAAAATPALEYRYECGPPPPPLVGLAGLGSCSPAEATRDGTGGVNRTARRRDRGRDEAGDRDRAPLRAAARCGPLAAG